MKNNNGCPCGMEGDCCLKPKLFTPDHECDKDFCEKCYILECENCGDSCGHEL